MQSFAQAKIYATGLLLPEGGIKSTVRCLPTVLYRLDSFVFASNILNLRATILLLSLQNIHIYLGSTPSKPLLSLTPFL